MATHTRAAGTGSAWTNSGNISVLDNTYATNSVNAGNASATLSATNFGFTLPTAAVINSISVKIVFLGSANFQDFSDKIGTFGGTFFTNVVTFYNWTTASCPHFFNLTPTQWGWSGVTAANINSSNFCYAVQAYNLTGSTQTVSVDYIEITITYDGNTFPLLV